MAKSKQCKARISCILHAIPECLFWCRCVAQVKKSNHFPSIQTFSIQTHLIQIIFLDQFIHLIILNVSGGRFRTVGTSYLTLIESLLGAIEWGPDLVDLLLQQEPGLGWIKVVGGSRDDTWQGNISVYIYIYISISIYVISAISVLPMLGHVRTCDHHRLKELRGSRGIKGVPGRSSMVI